MRELYEPHAIIESAEQAAAAGDYTSAEELLRKAALLQEARLGPGGPGHANTKKNHGGGGEMNGKTDDAAALGGSGINVHIGLWSSTLG